MLIGQASYGELNKGHALRNASSMATAAGSIVNQMDLRGSAPPGGIWEPYFSGFPIKDFYVLARTAADLSAVRPGMVRSRALFLPMSSLGEVENIEKGLQYLEDHFDFEGPLDDVNVSLAGKVEAPSSWHLPSALIESNGRTVVWPYESGFADAIANLWHNLWPEARRTLTFRLAFSPQDIVDQPTLVTTPPSLKTRWVGHPIVSDTTQSDDRAVALLAGSSEGDVLKAFIKELGAYPKSFGQLQQLGEVLDALNKRVEAADLIAATRLICFLSPDARNGANPKACLLKKLAGSFASVDASVLRMTRNLDISAIANGHVLWDAVRKWVADRLLSQSPEIISTIVADMVGPGPISAWKTSVEAGLGDALKRAVRDIPAIWRTIIAYPSVLPTFVAQGGAKAKFDRQLSEQSPRTIALQSGEQLLSRAVSLGLILTHAACCSRIFDPADAVARHTTEMAATEQSLRVTLSKASDQQTISIAVNTGNPILLDIAASHAAKKPSLIKDLDIGSPAWRQIWLRTMEQDVASSTGPRRPKNALHYLLDELIAGTIDPTGEQLLGKLARTSFANLIDYTQRSEVWPRLSTSSRKNYLTATAKGWLEAFEKDPDLARPEQPVRDAIIQSTLLDAALRSFRGKIALGCAFFRTFNELNEQLFEKWLFPLIDITLPGDQAAAIGRLVASRDWERTARALADICLSGRPDLLAALEYCVGQIGFMRRYDLDLPGTLAGSVKWQILEEIGVELYPIGPGDHGLWERAGGKNADIPRASNGREGWRIVVQDMQNGKRKIDPASLIAEMSTEYSNNRTLRKMRYDRFFR